MSKAIVAAVTAVMEIPGADKIQVAVVLGEQVIVSKDVGVGYVGVFFPVDTQLSEEYCYENNLSRHGAENKNPEKLGFFDSNRRVRAARFLKVKSEGYFAGLESLSYVVDNIIPNELGQTFDEIGKYKICNKYLSQATRDAIEKAGKTGQKMAKKDFAPLFKKHVESKQFKHEAHMIPVGALLSFHSKRHGTSGRSGITRVAIDLPRWKEIFNAKIMNIFPTEEWKHVVGSRNVTFKPTDEVREHHHGSDSFRHDVAKQIEPFLENGMTAFYEIVGSVNGKSIMPRHDIKSLKDRAYDKKYGESVTYSYGCKEHEYKWHIYRLTHMTANGDSVDFSQKQMEVFCEANNLPYTLEVSSQEIYDGDIEKLSKKVEYLTERPDVLTEDFTDPAHLSEGIIIRIDHGGMQPKFLKSKSFAFRCCEGQTEALDPEDLEAA